MSAPPIFHGAGDEEPLTDGAYAAEVYWGWKLLDWHDGEWWHPGRFAKWNAGDPVRWVGPLPERTKSPNVGAMVFDL